MRLLPLLLAAALLPMAAHAQSSSSGGGSMGSSSRSPGGSSGAAKTESAPSGTLRTGPDSGAGMSVGRDRIAPGGSRPGSGQQARMPDECVGPIADPRCPTAGAPTGTGLGDRGTMGGGDRPYGPQQSPVQGGPPFTGPTGRPLDLPQEGR